MSASTHVVQIYSMAVSWHAYNGKHICLLTLLALVVGYSWGLGFDQNSLGVHQGSDFSFSWCTVPTYELCPNISSGVQLSDFGLIPRLAFTEGSIEE